MTNSWGNAWGEDVERPEQQPVAQVDNGAPQTPDGPDRYIDNPPHDSADDPWYQPRWGAAPNGTNDSGPSPSQGPTLPNYNPQGAQDQYTNYPGDIGGGKQPLVPFDQKSYQDNSGQDSERNAGTTFAASSFDLNPSAPQPNQTVPVRPVQQYHDQLMDEIVNGNLNASLQDDGTWIVQPTSQTDNGEPQSPPTVDQQMQAIQQAQAAVAAVPGQLAAIDKFNANQSLVPTDQDANTPGVNHPNTLLGAREARDFNPADPTAGNVAPDAASKLLEATAASLAAVTLNEALAPVVGEAPDVAGALAGDSAQLVFGKTLQVTANPVAKWVADMSIRTGVAIAVAPEIDKLPVPQPLKDVLGFFPYTLNSSGLLGALEEAGVMTAALNLVKKSGIPAGPGVDIGGPIGQLNPRDAITMLLAGGLKGKLEEHIRAGEKAMTGPVEVQRPRTEAESPTITPDWLPESVANQLSIQHEAIRNADPEAMVTVYTGLSAQDAEQAHLHGMADGSVFTSDPEMAAVHAMDRGAVNPSVVSVTVPRALLEENGPSFLYHWTPDKNVDSIMANGLNPGSWLASTPEQAIDQARIPNRVSRLLGMGEVVKGTVLQVPADQGVVPARNVLTRENAFRNSEPIKPNAIYLDRPPQEVVRGWLANETPGALHDFPTAVTATSGGGEPVRSTGRPFYGATEAGILTDKLASTTSGLASGKGWIGPDGQAYAIRGNDIHAATTSNGVDQAIAAGWTRIEKDANGVYIHAPDLSSVENALRGSDRKVGDLAVDVKLPNGKTASFNGKLSDWLNSTARVRGDKITLTSGRPYEGVPDSLMGFNADQSKNKGFAESGFPHSQPVKVTFPGDQPFEDEIKGLNQNHALERGRRNWEGATVEPIGPGGTSTTRVRGDKITLTSAVPGRGPTSLEDLMARARQPGREAAPDSEQAIFSQIQHQDIGMTVDYGAARVTKVRAPDGGLRWEVSKLGEDKQIYTSNMEATRAVRGMSEDDHPLLSADKAIAADRAGVAAMSDKDLRDAFHMASDVHAAVTDPDRGIKGVGWLGKYENAGPMAEAYAMRDASRYGQELYRRTGGKEGIAPQNYTNGPTDISTTSAHFDNARQDAATLFATIDDLGKQINGGVTIPDVLQKYVDAHDQLMSTLSTAHQYGEELARATNGKQGPPAALRQAIKQFLVDEEGSLHLPQRTPEGKYTVNMGPADPLSQTTPPQIIRTPITDKLLAIDPIVPHLTPAQKLLNLAKDVVNTGVLADPLAQGIADQMAKSTEITRSHASDLKNRAYQWSRKVFKFDKDGNTVDLGPPAAPALGTQMHPGVPPVGGDVTAVTRVTINGETRYRIANRDGSITYFEPKDQTLPAATKPANIKASIQTIAADYAHWKGFLTPKQQEFMEWTRDALTHEQVAMSELGIDVGTRPDVQPGGWYLPRGDARVEGWAQDAHLPQLKNRGVKTGAEMTARFETMEQGKQAGYVYMPFHEAIEKYADTTGRRLLNEKMAQVLKNSTDEQGRPLASTPAALALRDPQHAAVASQMKTLKDWVSSLDASVTNLDERSRQIMEKFIASPAIDMDDWQTLRQAIDAMSTKAGTLRIKAPLAPNDLRTNFRILRQAVTQNLTVVRGQFKDLPVAAANRLATQKTLDDLAIKRGRFRGMDATQAQALLGNIKQSITNLTPQYQDALAAASRHYASIEPTGLGASLRDYRFPDRLAADLNSQLKAKQPAAGPLAWVTDGVQAGGKLLRTMRLAGDFATMTTHGTIGLFNNPKAYGVALKTMATSLADPAAIGAYLRDFDTRRAADGRPKVNDWVQAGSHVGDSGTGILGLNRTYAALTTSLRLELNDAGFDPEWNKLSPADRLEKMRDLASTNNIVTGYAPRSFLGSVGDNFLLAPRLIQSQIDLLGRGLNPKGGVMGVGDARRKLLTYFGVASALTIAANESGIFPQAPGFDYLSPRKNGQWNTDFMRVATPLGKVSMFGSYDWMLKAMEAATKGDFSYLPRTKAGPLASDIWDLASGHDFLGHPIDVKNPRSLLPWLVSSAAPIAPSEPASAYLRGALGTGPKVGIGHALGQFAISETGVKHSAETAASEYASLRDDTFQSMLKDGSIPPDVASLIQGKPFQELPLGVQKQVDAQIKTKSPDDYQWYHQQRLEADNIYEQRAAAADAERQRYAGKFENVDKMLMAGNNPYQVWTAYDSFKNELTGSLKTVYDGRDAEDYKNAVQNLPQSDMRRIEAGYDAIAFKGDPETYTAADWDKVNKEQAAYLDGLKTSSPDSYALLQYSLAQRDKLNLENAAPIAQLKKQASAMLQPYYTLVDAEKNGGAKAGDSQTWLVNHPDADYMHWLTEKPLTPDTTPKLHSPAAAAQALQTFAGTPRAVEIVGSKQPLNNTNLPILQQYAKQITQITTLPGKATDANGTSYSPVQRLRQSDPVYDALYTWLFASPQTDKQGRQYVVMYHADYVNQFLARVGGREDKVKPRTAASGGGAPF